MTNIEQARPETQVKIQKLIEFAKSIQLDFSPILVTNQTSMQALIAYNDYEAYPSNEENQSNGQSAPAQEASTGAQTESNS